MMCRCLGSWLGDVLHQQATRHSILMLLFSVTTEDTYLFKLIEKVVCGWLKNYKLFLVSSGIFFCFLICTLKCSLIVRGYLKATECLFECLIKMEMWDQPCSYWTGVHIIAVLMSTLVSNHGKTLGLTWPGCRLHFRGAAAAFSCCKLRHLLS